jgi:HSP20 family protein
MYRRYRMPYIWREMDQLQREMNRLMESPFGPRRFSPVSFPAINILTREDGLIVTAELPGMKADDIEINISADKLALSGERSLPEVGEDLQYHRRERSHGKFSRSIQLPFMVDPGKVEALFKDGVLEISMVRAEVDKPKKIAVKSL